MADIVVTVPKGYFKEARYTKDYFTFGGTRKPKRLKYRDRIYIAYEGRIEEFYTFEGYDEEFDHLEVQFYFGDRRQLVKPFPCKGFQGFRYAETVGLDRKRGRAKRRAPRKRKR